MPKSKHAPALFEVIGKQAKYRSVGGILRSNGRGQRSSTGTSDFSPTSLGSKTLRTESKAPAPVKRPRAAVPKAAGSFRKKLRSLSILKLGGGRVSFSLNTSNTMIAAGCLVLGAFTLFAIGHRSGKQDGLAMTGGATSQIDEVVQARRQPAQPSIVQLGMAKPAKQESSPPPNIDQAVTPLSLVRRTSQGPQGEPVSRGPDPKPEQGKAVIGPAAAPDPRVFGLTYIVIEYFPKSDRHDALAEARHAARFLAEKGFGTFIVAGQEGFQLVSEKGFNYKTEKQACLDYKGQIQRHAKDYKPLDRSYMFTSFPMTYNPPQ